MKKLLAFVLATVCLLGLLGCGKQALKKIKTYETGTKTYYELQDGSWECDGHIYKHRLELSGRMPDAATNSTFVYLSNREDITFEQAWKAAGLSSNSEDYFAVEDAVLVDWLTN